jgi:glycosyltransferase involved in cell wall biosynthesis
MRLLLDLQGAQTASRFRGIGRYTLSLAQAIVRNGGDHEIFIVLNGMLAETIEPIRAAFDGLLPQANIRVWEAPGPVRDVDPSNAARREVAERIREAFLASLEPDLVHVGSLFEGFADDAVTSIGTFAPQLPTAVTLFDLIPLTSPEPHPAFAGHYQRKLQSFRRADLWLGISQFSCQEAISKLHLDPEKVVNISCAANPQFKPIQISDAERARIMRRYSLSKPFICWVGTPGVRKNLSGLMHAFALLAPELRSQFQILIVGQMQSADVAALTKAASNFGLCRQDIVFAGYVDDHDLARLYGMCRAFVFPSLHEGFGLPVLEAMQCGAPVIASISSSLPEVVGLAEAMFDPQSVDAIANKLRRVLLDDGFRAHLIAHHLQYAQRFSWDQSAKQAIKAFEVCHLDRTNHLAAATIYDKLISSTAQVLKTSTQAAEVAAAALAMAQNHPELRSERTLYVDVSELCQRDARTGIQRVTRNILRQLFDHPPPGYKIAPVYATLDRYGYRHARDFTRKFLGAEPKGLSEDSFLELQPGDLLFVLDLQQHIVIKHRDFYNHLRRLGVGVYFMIYDLLPVFLPQYLPFWNREDHIEWLSVTSESDGVIAISRTVADQYLAWLDANGIKRFRPLRVGWCHIGADIANPAPTCALPEHTLEVLNAASRGPTFLMVGTIEPRKGYAQVISTFELLWARGYDLQLVIVGKTGWMVDELTRRLRRHPLLAHRLFWLDDVDDDSLDRLYGSCSCLLVASEGEGFGLPLVEAARRNLPILVRDIPVFREIAGDHAYFFAGLSINQLASAIIDWLALYAEGRHPKSDRMPYATWAQSVERLKAILLGGDWYTVWPSDGLGNRQRVHRVAPQPPRPFRHTCNQDQRGACSDDPIHTFR